MVEHLLLCKIVNGMPAVSYYDQTNYHLKFVCATDVSGTTWGAPIAIDVAGDVGQYSSLQVVDGMPAISYYDNSNKDLKYIRASDALGTTWGTPISIDLTGDVGKNVSLQIINGNPAISYYSYSTYNLKYIRANDASGTTWGVAVTIEHIGNLMDNTTLLTVNGYPAVSYQGSSGDLKYARANDVSGTTWGTPVSIDASTNNTGHYPTLQIVNGNPAVSYFDNYYGYLKFVRANDASGSAWNSPISIDVTGDVGRYASLQIIDGMPAVSYYDMTNSNLKYIKAIDAVGSTWGTPLSFDVSTNTGAYTSLQLVNGMPAVSYYDNTNFDLKYVRATNLNGSTWGTPVTIDATGYVGTYNSLQIVNGMPAISYFDYTNYDLKYVRATSVDGSTWGTPITIDAVGNVGYYTSLQIVNGMPAIAYYDFTNKNLKYIRANDVNGTTWGSLANIDVTGEVGLYPSLKIVNGNPAISYYDKTNTNLKYVRSTDVSGITWGTPVTIDITGTVGVYTSLIIVNGNPAISYGDQTNYFLKYVHANDVSGNTWGTPIVVDNTPGVAYYNSIQVVDGRPAISYQYSYSDFVLGTICKLRYSIANDVDGNTWESPITFDFAKIAGSYSSMLNTGCGVGIAFYNESEGFPSFIFGTLNTIIDSQPANAVICTGSNSTFNVSASGTGLTYQWQVDYGSGFVNLSNTAPYSNVTTPTLAITNASTSMNSNIYRCQISSGCSSVINSNTAILTVNPNPLPVVTANASSTTICNGTSVILAGGGASSYVWSGGINDGIGFIPLTTTTYTVTGTDANSCSNTASVTVTVNNIPTVTANASATNICHGVAVTLNGGGANSYIWSNGVVNGVGFIPAATTTYTVTGTDVNGCTNTASKTIVVSPTVTAFATDTAICLGTSVILTGGGSANTYVWSGGILNGVGFVPLYTNSYTVTGTDGSGCTDTDLITVIVYTPPVITAHASDTLICGGTTVTLTGSGAVSYVWSDGVTNSVGFLPTITTTYTVIGINAEGCEDTAEVTVTVKTWEQPLLLETLTGTGGNAGSHTSLLIVNGNPAMTYYDETHRHLMFVCATNASGTAWGEPIALDDIGNVGMYSSLQIVNGMPAVSYYAQSTALKYMHATDSSGTTWGSPVIVDASGDVGLYTSLYIVNGMPAISYYDNNNKNLKYVRATDVSGNSWGTPVAIDLSGDVGAFTSLKVVNGNPSISYLDYTNTNLKYVRATNANGSSWGSPITIDATGDVGWYSSLQVVNGNPAIAYYDGTNTALKYVRASNASGSIWDTPITVDGIFPDNVGQYISLQIINGNPAITYFDDLLAHQYLKYIRANDVLGITWGTPIVVDYSSGVGKYNSLQVINGNPAVSYYDETNGNLKYKRAIDASGNTWGTPVSIDVNAFVGECTSLQIVQGNPAVSYLDGNNKLRYKRALDSAGTVWGNPIIINQNGGSWGSLQIVNGKPAISFFGNNDDLLYISALDPLGTSWNAAILVDISGQAGWYASLKVVNGMPAISYYDITNGNLKYVRATDISGSTWGTPITIDNSANDVGLYTSLQIVNGMPAVSYFDASAGIIKYVRATDASGNSWGLPKHIESIGTTSGTSTSLQVVKGKPAISFFSDILSDLKYIRANDSTGTFWGGSITIDNSVNEVGYFPSLQIVRGMPAVSYYDQSDMDLKYVRATDSLGTAWSNPMVLDSTGDVGSFTSMACNTNGVGIAYYNTTETLPSFVYWDFSIVFTSQPTNASICNGNNASFNVSATCAGLTYQWQVNDGSGFIDLSNSAQYFNVSTPTLNIINANASMNGYLYRCRVTGLYSSVGVSNAAVLYVSPLSAPIVTANATSTTVCEGMPITLTGGGTATSYIWSDGIIDGVEFIPTSTSSYIVTGTGTGGCTNADTITITVNSINVSANATDTSVCAGTNTYVILTGSGALTYVWSGGIIDGVGFIPISTYTYTVIGTDVNGCIDTATKTIMVSLAPVLVITNPASICSPNTIDISSSAVTAGSSGGTISYWQDPTANIPLNISYYTAIDTSGIYYLKLDSANCFDIKPVTVNILDDCVWPGDADKDMNVTNFDLLPLGLFYGQTGTSRASVNNMWQACLSTNWGMFQSNGADIKHIDCNGDGLLNLADTLAINLNFSLSHSKSIVNLNHKTYPNLYFVCNSNYTSGDWVNVDIMAGNSANSVSNLYGIAFNIDFDASLVQSGSESIIYPNSWFASPGINAIKFSNINESLNTAYAAETRIDHNDIDGYGLIATFKFKLKSTITSTTSMNLSYSDYLANNSLGDSLYFNLISDTIIINPFQNVFDESSNSNQLSIYPNPSKGKFTVEITGGRKINKLEVVNILSEEIYFTFNNINQVMYNMDISSSPKGIYFVKIYTDENICTRKLIIQ